MPSHLILRYFALVVKLQLLATVQGIKNSCIVVEIGLEGIFFPLLLSRIAWMLPSRIPGIKTEWELQWLVGWFAEHWTKGVHKVVEKTDTAPHLEDFSLVHVILQHDRELRTMQKHSNKNCNMYSHLFVVGCYNWGGTWREWRKLTTLWDEDRCEKTVGTDEERKERG